MKLLFQFIRWIIDMKLMIQWAITSSILILIVLAARFLFKDKLSARARYALWGLVLLRLLVPVQVELPAPVSENLPVLATNAVREVTPWLDDTMLYAIPTEDQPTGEVPVGLPPQHARNGFPDSGLEFYTGGVVYDGERVTRYALMMTALEVVVMIWIAGTVLTALVILTSNLRFGLRLRKRRVRLEGPHPSSPAAMPPSPEGEGLAPRGTEVPVYTVEGLPSPCLFGVFKPAVYVIPEAAEHPDTLRHVLAHELTHYAHFDHIWSALRCLALALHWYNPLVWLAVGLSKGDGELACDEGAVARLGEAERIPYGRTLVDMVAARSPRPGDLLSCSTAMTGGEKSIQQRVARLVKKPETVKAALFGAVAVVALAAVFVFAGRGEQGTQGDYRDFQSHIKSAQAIHLSQSSLPGDDPFPDITDPELLEQARDILLRGTSDWLNPPSVLDELDPDSVRTLTLTGQDGRQVRYQLARAKGEETSPVLSPKFYVITEGSLSRVPGDRVAALLDRDAVSRLYTLMEAPLPLSDVERVFLRADYAVSIRYCPPPISSVAYPDPITDPELLDQARELLYSFTAQDPETVVTGWSDRMFQASRIILSDGATETTYALLVGKDGRTYLFPGDDYSAALALGQGETVEITPIGRTQNRSNVAGAMSNLAHRQQLLSQDPSTPVPMTPEELSEFTPEKILRDHGYQLQGWSGDLKKASFHYGYKVRTDDTLQLRYNGDADHGGVWVLEVWKSPLSSHSSGYDIRADLPMVVFNAERYASEEEPYEQLGAAAFAAALRPEDVVSVTAGDYEPGQAVKVDLQTLKEQLVQGLYHQLTTEFDEEKHGQYVITVHVEKDVGYYLQDGGRDGLILSVGSEPDTVCLRHRILSVPDRESCQFVRSPELYRTLREAADRAASRRGDLTPEQVAQVNEAFRPDVEFPDGSIGPSEISCFFTSSYDDPTKIDLEEFLRYCPLGELVDETADREEYRKVLKASFWDEYSADSDFLLPVPMHRYPREKVSALLQKYAGVTVEKLDWGNVIYLEEYDAFYNFTSDFGPGIFRCEGGEINGDTVLLWSVADGSGGRSELTLQKSGGSWLICAHHARYER